MFGLKTKSPDEQPPLPGAAVPAGFSGPVIEGYRSEMVPTLAANAEELMNRAPPNRCIKPGCGGQLSVFTGILMTDAGNGVKRPEDSDRCRRKSFVACATCRFPVPVNHPRQLALDRDWEAREALDRQEAERAKHQAALAASNPPKAPPVNQMMNVVEAVEAALDLLAKQGAEIQRLTHRVAALEKALREREQPVPF
jgi:hypothetical protein